MTHHRSSSRLFSASFSRRRRCVVALLFVVRFVPRQLACSLVRRFCFCGVCRCFVARFSAAEERAAEVVVIACRAVNRLRRATRAHCILFPPRTSRLIDPWSDWFHVPKRPARAPPRPASGGLPNDSTPAHARSPTHSATQQGASVIQNTPPIDPRSTGTNEGRRHGPPPRGVCRGGAGR